MIISHDAPMITLPGCSYSFLPSSTFPPSSIFLTLFYRSLLPLSFSFLCFFFFLFLYQILHYLKKLMDQRIKKICKFCKSESGIKGLVKCLWKQYRFNFFININLNIKYVMCKCLLYSFSLCFLEPEWCWRKRTNCMTKSLSYWWLD